MTAAGSDQADDHSRPVADNPWFSNTSPTTDFISPSLNQVQIVDLSGLTLPADIPGHTGYELLSAAALRRIVQDNAAALALDPAAPNLIEQFDNLIVAFDPALQTVAAGLAAQYGRRLGYLLLALHQVDPVNRQARPQWGDPHWSYWQAIRHVRVGGGLMSGNLGLAALPHAQAILNSAQASITVQLADYPGLFPLIGAARYGLQARAVKTGHDEPTGRPQAALVLDLGHSRIKRAWAVYAGGYLVGLHQLGWLPSPCDRITSLSPVPEHLEAQVVDLIDLLVESWQTAPEMGLSPVPHVVLSLACYLRNGQPCQPNDSCYGRLAYLSDDLPAYLSRRLSRRLGHPMAVTLLHDGSAAASQFAGQPLTAVLVLGTALGIGFPPIREDGLCPLADNMTVRNLFLTANRKSCF